MKRLPKVQKRAYQVDHVLHRLCQVCTRKKQQPRLLLGSAQRPHPHLLVPQKPKPHQQGRQLADLQVSPVKGHKVPQQCCPLLRRLNKKCPMTLGLKLVHLRRPLFVCKVKSPNCVLLIHKQSKRLRVLRKMRPCQHGTCQLLMVKRTPAVQNLHRNLYGNRRKPAPAKKVTLLRTRRAQVYKVFCKLPWRKWPT